MKYLVLVLLILGCKGKGTTVDINNAKDNFEVQLLFIKDKCKVYRFYDMRYHYFTDCTQTLNSYTESCGKNCNRDVNETIGGSK